MDALDKFSYICFNNVVFQLLGYTVTFYTPKMCFMRAIFIYSLIWHQRKLISVIWLLFVPECHLPFYYFARLTSKYLGYVKIKSPMYINISICSRSIKVHGWNSRHLNPDTRCNTEKSVTLQPLHPRETFKQDSEFAKELYGDYISGANEIRHGGEGSSRCQFKI
jgi:hypothetical protein